MQMVSCSNRDEFMHAINSPEAIAHWKFGRILAQKFADVSSFTLPGICTACKRRSDFLVDWQYSSTSADGVRNPKWREWLVCSSCKMNNRQRVVITATLPAIKRHATEKTPKVFFLEQVTPMFHWYSQHCTQAECIGSEWVGPDVPSGTIRNGIRHEDCERLSFNDGELDFIISNEVLEHVNNPMKALQEKARVLRDGGELFMTVPFSIHADKNVVRARFTESGELEHLLPKVFHGNPMSSEGSLVFTDFGWELLDNIRTAGFSSVSIKVHNSIVHMHIGVSLFFFHAIK